MTSLFAHPTGIRNPRAPRDEQTPSSPVVSEGFQSEIPEYQHSRKHGDTARERRLAGYRSRGAQAANLAAGTRMTPLRRRSGAARGAAAPAALAVKEVGHSRRPVQMRNHSSSKVFPRESTREVWLTNDPAHLEEDGSGETVLMVGDSERHHLELAKLYGFPVSENGKVLDDDGEVIGRVVEGEADDLVGQTVDDDGEILDEDGDLIGRVDVVREEGEERTTEEFGVVEGLKANKQGNVMDAEGVPIAYVVGETAVVGREIGRDRRIRDANGTVIGEVELIPEDERMYAIVRQMRDAIEPLRCQMKLANKHDKSGNETEKVAKTLKPLVEDARLALQECDTALRAHTSENAEHVDRHLADLIKDLGESVVETIDNACQLITDSTTGQHVHPLITLLVEPPLYITVTIALRVVGLYARILNSLGIGNVLRFVLRRVGVYQRLEEFGLGAVIEVLELGSTN